MMRTGFLLSLVVAISLANAIPSTPSDDIAALRTELEALKEAFDKFTTEVNHKVYKNTIKGSVYFDAYRTTLGYVDLGILTYEGLISSTDSGMDQDTGVFTCPKAGTYQFSFHAFTMGYGNEVDMQLNGEVIAYAVADQPKDMISQTIILELKKGDEVRINVANGNLWEHSYKNTHFVGFLLA